VRVLVCMKRVPAPGARIVLTEDGSAIDDRHLGFTISPHEECAVEEAVRLTAQHGGEVTALTLGPDAAAEQLRFAISLGAHHGVLLETDEPEWDPRDVAHAITATVRTLEDEAGPFDLILFGNESADAANHQVGIRVAHALGRPVVAGVKAIEVGEGDRVGLHRSVADGFERCEVSRPAVATVKEGINVPRYPAMRGRLQAAKAQLRVEAVRRPAGGLTTLGLRHPEQQETETVVLGHGADAAPAVADLLARAGVL
jgi:electron transfer flavoprotein beta subunit